MKFVPKYLRQLINCLVDNKKKDWGLGFGIKIGDWEYWIGLGFGIGDWGLGIGDWGLGLGIGIWD